MTDFILGITTGTVDWSRAQFALTAIYHWLFVPLLIKEKNKLHPVVWLRVFSLIQLPEMFLWHSKGYPFFLASGFLG